MPRLAKYELLSKIASGGMAEIYVARTRSSGYERVCVVKKLLPQHADKEDFIQMFLDEGRVAAALNHPNVVQMFEFGSDGGDHYLAMEYLHGEDLRTVMRAMRAEGRLIPREHVLNVVIGVCAGLHHAHEARSVDGAALEIVHRDVSPHNVFVTFEGGVKVVDFGIATSHGRQTETKHGTLKGKVPYMSPEQIKGKKVDRRTDVYAVGVMLYELLLGRRPYVLPNSGEFALMMAIARNDVRPATNVDPSFPPALDAIVQRAMAYDPRTRYQTMRELQADLEAYARESGHAVSPLALSEYMASLFGDRVEAWRAAQKNAHVLAAHVVEVEEERAQSGIHQDDEADGGVTEVDDPGSRSGSVAPTGPVPQAAPSQAAVLVASTSSAVASVVELLGVTVITLRGRLDETFEGTQLGESLGGTVLFDLAGVERITSFGVREWLEMMKAIERQGDVDAYLARCSEPIVTQLSLIRTFASPAKVVSFQVPYLCDDCGMSFHGSLDCERDAELLESRVPPSATCPRCSGPAKYDDDPTTLAFATPFLRVKVPDKVRQLVTTLESSAHGTSDAVEKHVTPTETRFRVHRDVEKAFRWNRVLDGVDGKVVFDFRGVLRMSPETAATFARAVRGLGPDVTSCEILECPSAVLRALGRDAIAGKLDVPFACFEGRCPACAAQRSGRVAMSTLRAAHAEGRPPVVSCGRCNAALEAADASAVVDAVFTTEETALLRPIPTNEPFTPPAPSVASVALAPKPRRTGYVALVAASGVVAAALAIFAVTRVQTPSAAATSPVATGAPSATATTTIAESSPAEEGASGPVHRDGHVEVSVVGAGATEDEALQAARTTATLKLLEEIEAELPPDVRSANASLRADPRTREVLARFERDVGSFASPERTSARARAGQSGTSLVATYRIGDAAWAKAVAYYGATQTQAGLVFARVFPSRGEGVLVARMSATKIPGVGVGAVLEAIDGRASPSLETVARLERGRHETVFSLQDQRAHARLETR